MAPNGMYPSTVAWCAWCGGVWGNCACVAVEVAREMREVAERVRKRVKSRVAPIPRRNRPRAPRTPDRSRQVLNTAVSARHYAAR